MRSLETARQLLGEWGVCSHGLLMILFAMIEDDVCFDEAVSLYATYSQKEPQAVLAEVREAVDKAVETQQLHPTARLICEACYNRAGAVDSL